MNIPTVHEKKICFVNLNLVDNQNYMKKDAQISVYSNEKRIQHNAVCSISMLEKSEINSFNEWAQ